MLWKIEGSSTYILGSIHLTNMNPLFLPAPAERVYSASNRIIFEADTEGAFDQTLLQLPNQGQLSQVLSGDLFRETSAQWSRLGFPEGDLRFRRPLFVAFGLQFGYASRNGYFPQLGVDSSVRARAIGDGKLLGNLESLAAQATMLANLPMAEQISFLAHIVDQDNLGLSDFIGILSAWKNGDVGHLERMLAQRQLLWPLTTKLLLTDRNQAWVPSIVKIAGEIEPTLIVVGMMHLVGPAGLPVLLREHGLRAYP